MYDFDSLKPISRIIYIIGVLIMCLGIIAVIALFSIGDLMSILIGIGVIFGVGFICIFCFAFSDLIKLLLQIELNTRKDKASID